jgi:hypothetical protein
MKPTGQQIRASVARWQRWLGLEGWQITVKVGRIAGGHRGTCECDWSYKEAILRFDPTAMHKHGDDLEEIVGHEAWHILIWRSHTEIQRVSKTKLTEHKWCEVEEAECTDASRAFLRVAKEGRLL